MGWLDTTVVIIVVALGLLILYKALKEPIDLLLGLIGKAFGGIKNSFSREDSGYDMIEYG